MKGDEDKGVVKLAVLPCSSSLAREQKNWCDNGGQSPRFSPSPLLPLVVLPESWSPEAASATLSGC